LEIFSSTNTRLGIKFSIDLVQKIFAKTLKVHLELSIHFLLGSFFVRSKEHMILVCITIRQIINYPFKIHSSRVGRKPKQKEIKWGSGSQIGYMPKIRRTRRI
jgi:hypothetical protein